MATSHKPLWFFRRPSDSVVRHFLARQQNAPFSFAEVGATRQGLDAPNKPPSGYNADRNRVRLGTGEPVFARACAALRGWRMFPAPWTSITPADAPIREGSIVAMQAHALGLWWLNACKIVYMLDETTPMRRFGFAYGTLPAHVEQGEERFSVELHGDGSVWYDLRAISRPRYWPVRLAKPLARRLQERFVRESLEAMKTKAKGGENTNA